MADTTDTTLPDGSSRYFEFVGGKSKKFWEVRRDGADVTVRYGRIGTDGQAKTKSFADPDKAAAHAAKLIVEKTGKGYVEQNRATAGAKTAFEKQLAEDPDDVETLAVYADWLIDQGDPRGELIQVQLALEDESRPKEQRKELKKREAALLKKHEKEWLGEMRAFLLGEDLDPAWEDSPENFRYEFERGRLSSLHISSLSVPMARALRDWQGTRFLRDLAIEYVRDEGEGEYEPGPDVPTFDEDNIQFNSIFPLLGTPSFAGLRRFQVGVDVDRDLFLQSPHIDCGLAYCNPAADLAERMPGLLELHLLCQDFDIEKLFRSKKLKRLQVLRICNLGVSGSDRRPRSRYEYPLDVLAKNRTFSELTHLLFHPHHEEYHSATYGGDHLPSFLPLEQVEALVNSRHLKKLRHLQLRLSNMGDEGCRAIVKSGILRQLKSLDLRHGCISDEGAHILAECPDLAHLDHLDLSRNGLREDGIAALRAAGVGFRAEAQQTDSELAEEQYLREGDFE